MVSLTQGGGGTAKDFRVDFFFGPLGCFSVK